MLLLLLLLPVLLGLACLLPGQGKEGGQANGSLAWLPSKQASKQAAPAKPRKPGGGCKLLAWEEEEEEGSEQQAPSHAPKRK